MKRSILPVAASALASAFAFAQPPSGVVTSEGEYLKAKARAQAQAAAGEVGAAANTMLSFWAPKKDDWWAFAMADSAKYLAANGQLTTAKATLDKCMAEVPEDSTGFSACVGFGRELERRWFKNRDEVILQAQVAQRALGTGQQAERPYSAGPAVNAEPSPPSFAPPTGTDPSGPACATGQQEVVSAQKACANGNAAMCTRVSQLMNAMRSINCTIPVLAGGQRGEPGGPTGQQRAAASPPLTCVRQQRMSSGNLELYNGCGFVVNYSFCVQGSRGPFACKPSMDSESMDSIRPGQTSSNFVGTTVVFAACRGAIGSPEGLTSHLEGGRGSCRP